MPTGSAAVAGWAASLQRCVEERTPIDGDAIKWERTARGMRPIVKIPRRTGTTEAVSADFRMFKVVSVRGDFLVCNEATFNTTTGIFDAVSAAAVIVAKPWTLRQSPFDATTRDGVQYNYDTSTQRRLTRGIYVETQVITPAYTVAGSGLTGAENTAFDIIWARDISGLERRDYVKAYTADTELLTPGQFHAADWIDVNQDARAWGAKALLIA